MYLVLKGFANNTISASKGKTIEIKDKKLASSLLEAGYITTYSEKEISNKEAKETISKLQSQLAEKDVEIQSLKDKITELEAELNNVSDEVTDDKEKEKNSNLDENKDLTPNEDEKENGEESKTDDENMDDKKSSKK